MKILLFCSLSVLALVAQHTSSFAQTGVPRVDTSFNHTGNVALDWLLFFEPNNMAIQADGKILAGGYGRSDQNGNLDGYIFRVNGDGTFDKDFGDAGLLILDIDGGADQVSDFVVLPDNKILVLLESANRTILVKLMPNGSFDPSFGNDGLLLVPTEQLEFCKKILIQADQKIIIVSKQIINGNRVIGTVRRCNPDGSLDNAYGNNGYVQVTIDMTKNLDLNAGVIQPDGKLLVTGHYGAATESGFPVIRLNTDGSFDNSFSGDGIYVKLLGNSVNDAMAESIAVDSNGKIFVGGSSPTQTDIPLTVFSLTPSGGVNGSFGTFGVARIPFNLFASARKMIVQPDGKILAGGYKYQTLSTTRLAFARFNTNGTADATFGDSHGRFVDSLPVSHDVQAIQDIMLQSDGRIVGLVWLNETINLGSPGNNASCYLVRYLSDIALKAEEPSLLFQDVSVSPNPVGQEEVTLSYSLEKPCKVAVSIYDVNGMELETLIKPTSLPAGDQQQQVNLPSKIASGTYFLVLSTETAQKVVKIVKI